MFKVKFFSFYILLCFFSVNSVYSQDAFPNGQLNTDSLLYEISVGESEFGFFIIGSSSNIDQISITGNDSGKIGFRIDDSDNSKYHLFLKEPASSLVENPYSYTIKGTKKNGRDYYFLDLTLTISTSDDTAPVITSGTTGTNLAENSGAGQAIYTIEAADAVSYAIAGTDAGLLSVNSSTGVVSLIADPDFETKSSYSFTVTATDAAGNQSAATTVTFSITDVDDTAPEITSGTTGTNLAENSGAGQAIYTIEATDAVSYAIGGTDASKLSLTGKVLSLVANPDYEIQSSYSFTVTATDAAGNESAATTVTFSITDVDDTAPEITSGTTGTNLAENSGAGQAIYTIEATDAVSYAIGGTDASKLSLTGKVLSLVANPDYEIQSSYSFTVTATDAAGNESAATTVTFSITDVDDTAPEITSGTTGTNLAENSGAGQAIYTIEATDAVSYAIGGTDASKLSLTGKVLSLVANPDYEIQSSYSFTVTATDAAGNESAATTVTFSITDVDDTAPEITSGTTGTNLAENSGAGQAIYTIEATDAVSYAIGGTDASKLSLTGKVLSLVANPDYEIQSSYSFTVTATDAAGNESAATTVTFSITDVDDTAPVIINNILSEIGELTTSIGSIEVNESVSFFIEGPDSSHISISNEGVLTLNAVSYYDDKTSYNFKIIAKDISLNSSDIDVTVNVLDEDYTRVCHVPSNDGSEATELYLKSNSLQGHLNHGDTLGRCGGEDVTPPLITSGTTGTNLAENSGAGQAIYTIVAADAVSYAIAGTDAGLLSVNSSTGVVSLIADPDFETKSSYSFTVTATDAAGNQSAATTVTFSITDVDDTVPVIALEGANPQSIELGTAYSELGATATDNIDGTITGNIVIDASEVKVNEAGDYTVTYNVSDAAGNPAVQVTRTVTITADKTIPVIALEGANPQSIELGTAYSELGATATDNIDGTITSSIVIDASEVKVNEAGDYTVTYNVSDAAGNPAVQVTRTVTITADKTIPVIALEGANPQSIELGTAYSELGATATDNIDGTITSSIVIDASEVKVNEAGDYTVTYNVSDAAGNPAVQVTRTVTITADKTIPVIALEGANPQSIELGTAYSELGATATDNIDGTITSSIVIDASEVKVNEAGDYTVTYNVSDAAGNPAVQVTRTVTITADKTIPVIALEGANPQSIELGTAYSELGATATDNIDGTITGNIVIDASEVKVNEAGDYTVTYNVSDAAGNPAVQVTRTVTITADKTIPVIALEGANPQSIELGTAYSELGATATDNIDGTITGNIVIDASEVKVNEAGDYTVTYNVSDAAGNPAVQVTRTVTITADKTIPVIALEGANPQSIELGTAYSELGATATDNIDGTITGNIVIDASEVKVNEAGDYTVTYNVSDAAGNPAVQVTRTVNVKDTKAPIVTVLGLNPINIGLGGTYSEPVEGDDIGAKSDGGEKVEIKGSVTTSTKGEYTITYTATDESGNIGTATRIVNVKDTKAPIVTLIGANPMIVELGDTYSEPVEGDDIGAKSDGVEKVTITGSVNTTEVGTYTVTYTATDGNSNTGIANRTVNVVNEKGPVISIEATLKELGLNQSSLLQFKFNRDILELKETDINVSNGQLLEFSKDSNNKYSAIFIPNENFEGEAIISIAALTVEDNHGVKNANRFDLVITVNTISDTNVVPEDAKTEEGVPVQKSLNGTDSEAGKTLTYSLDSYETEKGVLIFNSDATYTFTPKEHFYGDVLMQYSAKDSNENVYGPYKTTIEVRETPDQDGIPTAVETIIEDSDLDKDGIPDRKADHIASFPMSNADDFDKAMKWDPKNTDQEIPKASNFGSIMVADEEGSNVAPNKSAQLKDIGLIAKPNLSEQNDLGFNFNADLLAFKIVSPESGLIDQDGDMSNGTQIRMTINLPSPGKKANTYIKNDIDGNPFVFLDDQNLSTWDEGATLIDLNNDGLIDKIILTIKDNGLGDTNPEIGKINDPGGLGLITPIIIDQTALIKDENLANGSFLIDINDNKTDKDYTLSNENITYTLDISNSQNVFDALEIDASSGIISVKKSTSFDFEEFVNENGISKMSAIIRATDSNGNYDKATILFEILNVDELPIIVSDTQISYYEKTPTSQSVTNIQILPDYLDVDNINLLNSKDYLSFSLVGNDLFFVSEPDYNEKNLYELDLKTIDNNLNEVNTTLTINILEDLPTSLTLLGDNPISIGLNNSFNDPGVLAIDDVEGDITFKVTSSNTIDSSNYGSYLVTYSIIDRANNNSTIERIVKVVDVTLDVINTNSETNSNTGTAPVITLNGVNPITVKLRSEYTDAGATSDGGETVRTSGTVNTSLVGVYTLTYTSTDGTNETTATRTVIVEETKAPVINVTGANPAIVELGSLYTDLGATSNEAGTISSTSTVDTNKVGSYTITYSQAVSSGYIVTATRTVEVADLDIDLDGLKSSEEKLLGSNPYNKDTDGDGILDGEEGYKDTDGDGILDILESIIEDTDKDGVTNQFDVNNLNVNSDSDGDGYSDLEETEDLKRSGRSDLIDPLNSSKFPPLDNDKDNSCDWHDKDDDNDKLDDEFEIIIGTNSFLKDTDGDLVSDFDEYNIDLTDPLNKCSLNLNSQANYLDNTSKGKYDLWLNSDCDNDGIRNIYELGLDTDLDGIDNWLDNDDDGDGILTIDEIPDLNLDGDPIDAFDSNFNSIADYLEVNNKFEQDEIEIYNAFSPNGDGINDVFTIRNIEFYPENEILIFNRWNQIVYKTTNYGINNIFKGKHQKTGDLLPKGTYFYRFSYLNSNRKQIIMSGYIFINL